MLTEAQRRALAFDRSVCVTASAGTGKTHVLVSRYLHLLENTGCRPSEILALTFTEKAAAEMKDRIFQEVYAREGTFWEDLRDQMNWARISTIHSFCVSLLQEFSYESGLSSVFSVIDDHDLATLLEERMDLLFLRKEHDELRVATARCLNAWGESSTRSFLRALYEKRNVATEFFSTFTTDREKVLAHWEATARDRLMHSAHDRMNDKDFVHSLVQLNELASVYAGDQDGGSRYLAAARPYLTQALDGSSPEAVAHALGSLTSLKGITKTMGSKQIFKDDLDTLRNAGSRMKTGLKPLPTKLIDIDLSPSSPPMELTLDLTRDLQKVFSAFLLDIEAEKHRAGWIDYLDMIILAATLLKEHPAIARTLERRYSFIMVDEFQDTDPGQAGIIHTILASTGAIGKLFVVGDPKQSIYLFRDADVTRFNDTQKVIESWGGDVVPLDENFRSAPEIVRFTNFLFSRIFTDSGDPWDFPYVAVAPTRTREEDTGTVEVIFSDRGENALLSALEEFSVLARKIASVVAKEEKPVWWDDSGNHLVSPRAPEFKDIAVLIEKRTHLVHLLAALVAEGIPYRVHRGMGFYQAAEVVDLMTLFSYLLDTSDAIALYGVLRSPYFGFSDEDLFSLCKGRGKDLFFALHESADPRFRKTCSLLDGWVSLGQNVPASYLLKKVIGESGILIVYSALPDGNQKKANLDKVAEFLREHERAGYYSIDRFLEDLLLQNETVTREGEADTGDGANQVTIMTVHASKGLEFPIVFVPRISEEIDTKNGNLLIDHDLGIGIRIPSPDRSGKLVSSPPYDLIKHYLCQKQEAEYKRLFYVAVTRAKDHLILCGSAPKPAKDTSIKSGTLTRAGMLMTHLGLVIPEAGHSSVFTGIPDLSVTVTRSVTESLPSVSRTRQMITPDTTDQRDFPEWSRHTDPGDRASRTFSQSEVQLFITNPERHRIRYLMSGNDVPSGFIREAGETAREEGLVLHEILSGKPILQVLTSHGIACDTEIVSRYQSWCDRIMALPPVRNADTKYMELPFLLDLDGYRVQGAIDLLVHSQNGWTIIDYKTGYHVRPRDYHLQLAVYQIAAEAFLHEPVKTCLFLIQTGEVVDVETDTKSWKKIVRDACSALIDRYREQDGLL